MQVASLCTACRKEVPKEVAFCSSCGTSNPDFVSSFRCKECAAELASEDTFCPSCGTRNPNSGAKLPRVGFIEAIKLCFSKYGNRTGRATRAEYWWFELFVVGVAFILAVVEEIMGLGTEWRGPLTTLWNLATMCPVWALGARRLHDINKSAWWLLLWFAILIGWIILIVWAIKKGDEGSNKYGPDPQLVAP
ncbi:zinc-ribbon domain-containing protein [Dehalococcoidia bacterium]|nr:zinc-ribbon domain-containing protein [Dehalococcoidia bacterium]